MDTAIADDQSVAIKLRYTFIMVKLSRHLLVLLQSVWTESSSYMTPFFFSIHINMSPDNHWSLITVKSMNVSHFRMSKSWSMCSTQANRFIHKSEWILQNCQIKFTKNSVYNKRKAITLQGTIVRKAKVFRLLRKRADICYWL